MAHPSTSIFRPQRWTCCKHFKDRQLRAVSLFPEWSSFICLVFARVPNGLSDRDTLFFCRRRQYLTCRTHSFIHRFCVGPFSEENHFFAPFICRGSANNIPARGVATPSVGGGWNFTLRTSASWAVPVLWHVRRDCWVDWWSYKLRWPHLLKCRLN